MKPGIYLTCSDNLIIWHPPVKGFQFFEYYRDEWGMCFVTPEIMKKCKELYEYTLVWEL